MFKSFDHLSVEHNYITYDILEKCCTLFIEIFDSFSRGFNLVIGIVSVYTDNFYISSVNALGDQGFPLKSGTDNIRHLLTDCAVNAEKCSDCSFKVRNERSEVRTKS